MRDDGAFRIEALTLREAVRKRPHMYFGSRPATDWPLIMMAWTAADLLERGDRLVTVTVHADGDFSERVHGAVLSWPARLGLSPEPAIRRVMWWSELARAATITVTNGATAAGRPPEPTIGEHGRPGLDGVDITVRFAPDPDVVDGDAQLWWLDWQARLPQIFAAIDFTLGPDQRLALLDEPSGTHCRLDATGRY